MRTRMLWSLAPAAVALLLAGPAAAEGERTFENLRYEEDWSFLENGHVTPDFFDGVKNQRLGGPWRLSFGGTTRLRYEADSNLTLGTDAARTDAFGRLRQSLNLDISRGGMFRWFSEVSHADTMSSDRAKGVRDENDADLQNFFFDFTAVPTTPHSVTFRVGRQEMAFGRERLVGPDDFANVRTTFDGMRIIGRTRRTETSLFAMRPVERLEKHDLDEPSADLMFSGIHAAFLPAPNHRIEGYAMRLHDDREMYLSEKSATLGDLTRDTIGVRYQWTRGGWMVETELAYQMGDVSDDDIRAGFGTVGAAYEFRRAAWMPRLEFGVEMATGDENPFDGRRGGFDPLFGSTRTGLGHMGITGRRNIEAVRLEVGVTPLRGMRWESGFVVSRLEAERDALSDQYGTTLRKDPTGTSGRSIGFEAHSQVSYTFMTHHTFSLEVARFWGGDVVEAGGMDDDATSGWAGYQFRF